jgi:hypothetical protein
MKTLSILLVALAGAAFQETKNADDLFKDALAKAKDSKRKVFLTFGSPG